MSLIPMRNNRPLSWVLLTAFVANLAFVPAGFSQTAKNFLSRGIEQYQNAEFETAILSLQMALQRGLKEKDDIIQARKYLAFSYTAMGETEKARKEYLTLLEAYPIFDLMLSESPKLREPYVQAKKEFDAMDREAPKVEAVLPDSVDEGTPLKLSAIVSDQSDLEPVSFYYKSTRAAQYDKLIMTREFGGTHSVMIPPEKVTLDGVDAYVEAKDVKGNGPGMAGSRTMPLRINVRMVDKTPPVIQHTPVINAPENKELAISADITDRSGLSEAAVFYRKKGEIQYLNTELRWTQGNRYSATLPAETVTEAGLEYFIQASDRAGNPPATSGLAASPYKVEVFFIDKDPPKIEHDEIATALNDKPIPVFAAVTDRSGVAEVVLFYKSQTEKKFLEILMRPTGMTQYAAEIPQQAVTEAGVQYYIQAKDKTGNPPSAYGTSQKPFTIEVSRFDQEPPKLAHMGVAEGIQNKPVPVKAMVIDNVGVKDVLLYHRKKGEKSFKEVLMTPEKNDLFLSQIQADTTDIEYYIVSRDVSGNAPSFWQSSDKPQVINIHPDKPVVVTKKKTSKWVYIGAGVAAVGGGALGLLFGGKKTSGGTTSNPRLPDPPGTP